MKSPPSRPESAQHYLRTPGLRSLLQALEKHRALLISVKALLPAELGAHCISCAAVDDRLNLYTDTPAHAFQLRFYLPAIEKALRPDGIRAVKLRQLPTQATKRNERTPPPPSDATIGLIRDFAETEGESDLGRALLNLSRTLGRIARSG